MFTMWTEGKLEVAEWEMAWWKHKRCATAQREKIMEMAKNTCDQIVSNYVKHDGGSLSPQHLLSYELHLLISCPPPLFFSLALHPSPRLSHLLPLAPHPSSHASPIQTISKCHAPSIGPLAAQYPNMCKFGFCNSFPSFSAPILSGAPLSVVALV